MEGFETKWALGSLPLMMVDGRFCENDKKRDRGFINYPFISKYDPFLKDMRKEERFKTLMERVKHEWESFEA